MLIHGNDKNWPQVGFLLAHNGVNNSTAISDATGKVTVTLNGDTKVSTGVTRFGRGGLLFDGSGDYITLSSHSDLTIGTSDFSVEFAVYFTAIGAYRRLVSSTTGGFTVNSLCIRLQVSNKLYAFEGVVDATSTTTITTNTWYTVLVTRISNVLRLYVNGNLEATTSGATGNLTEPIRYLGGYYSVNSAEYHNGYLDNIRITKAIGRPNQVPIMPFPAY